ncbi:MAG: efflux RND transporter periplasmic adaptor subunit [Hydrogenophaga sp.]|uniref:efflux RND transporter periplasmic adaptor subunit n=1 Tax=Hydrogenophaga sp. TaxID=1904254 RepID=UPI00271DFAC2|nr:efflux RND transporter periplasmic adaptor subunit [Hydrogenophaga sp.]MDO9149241.1 efflux RND transporter periplasmic adaptor subunit [Hydrogenophaga sp.]MDO9606463.1 efflux RND transporter periplasmic adaptor subunit [Hydrogenophaga sp.]MDP2164444.1 efflux RND transporter periplasmic adaptor subunit [Hydrogenophaga sp.]MDP3475103.1 efflux RND transporter periplasmic adaptor subunit [Hydrogenophaga sp.]
MTRAASAPAGRRWLGVAGAVLVVAIGWGAWLFMRGPLVDTVTVQAAPLVRTLQFSARVATLSRVEVGSTITGRVAQVLVNEGAAVRQGDVLLRLESDELDAAWAQAQATQQQAQARLAGLRSTGRSAASAAVAQADANLRAAVAELTRTEQLVAQGFLSASRLDDVRRAVAVAQAQQASARAQNQAVGESGTELAQAQAQLAVAQAASAAAQARQAQASVRAPADAQVLLRAVEPGQIVQPGRALMALALAGPTQLSAQVDERFLDQLRPDQTAAVVADAFPAQRFMAKVLSIAPAVDAQRGAIEVRFSLVEAAPAYLREDMTLSVEVETARRDSTLVLPLAALRDGAASVTGAARATGRVLVRVEGRAQPRDVRLGLRTLDAVEVLEGLSAGDEVLIGAGVQEGQRVRTRPVSGQQVRAAVASSAAGDAGSALTNAMGR